MDSQTMLYIGIFVLVGIIISGLLWFKSSNKVGSCPMTRKSLSPVPANLNNNIEESFINSPMGFKVQNLVGDKSGLYYSTPGFTNFYSPRFSTFDSNATLQPAFGPYPMPGSKASAIPSNPLGYESPTVPPNLLYSSQIKPDSNSYPMSPYMNQSVTSQYVKQPTPVIIDQSATLKSIPVVNAIPPKINPPSMSPEPCETCNQSVKTADNTVVVDRLIFANRNSNLRSMGDPIRGDLPIVPNPPGWFTPSVTPQIDLQRGAMNILVGNNEASNEMNNLLMQSTDGLLNDYYNTTNTSYVQLANRGADIIVSAYP